MVRLALVVAPLDPLAGSESARRESLAWLRGQLAKRGFQVAIVGAGEDPTADLERALGGVSSSDVVLVHVSGRLEGDDAVAMGKAGSLRLADLGDILAARSPGYVSVILDLQRDVDPGEGRDEAEIAAEAARAFGGEERGYSVLAAICPTADGADRMGFTRLALPPFDESDGPPSTEVLLATMHERASASGAGALGQVFLRGAADSTVDGLVAAATAAREWQRVVELRVDRAESLATTAQRVHDLMGVARILLGELRDADAAIDVLEHARSLDPRRTNVIEALRHAYEAAGRAPPIDPADFVKAFTVHRRAGQTDAALLDAMALVEMGAAEPAHAALVEELRSVGPVQILRPLDAAAWSALRAPGFDESVAALLASVQESAIAARIDAMKSSRKLPLLDAAERLDDESTVSAVRTFHWAARVLGVTCPDLYAGGEGAGDLVTQVPAKVPSIVLAPGALSGTSTKQLAYLAGSCLTWHLPEYRCLLYYPTLEDLGELVRAAMESTGAGSAEIGLEHWIRSAELTAARAGLLLCGELKTAVAAVRSQPRPAGRPTAERITGDLVAFCASRAHAELRARFVAPPGQSIPPAANARSAR